MGESRVSDSEAKEPPGKTRTISSEAKNTVAPALRTWNLAAGFICPALGTNASGKQSRAARTRAAAAASFDALPTRGAPA